MVGVVNLMHKTFFQSQAKILAKGKKIPFATDDEYTNEELGKRQYEFLN